MRVVRPLLVVGMSAAALVSAPVVSGATAAAPTAGRSGSTVRVSVVDGGQPNDISARSSRPALSSDGSVIAFDSIATNLVPGDTNGWDDVFVRTLGSKTVRRVSVGGHGQQGNDDSTWPSVSGDGHVVTFTSSASNLLPQDTNNRPDVFARDLVTDQLTLVSASRNGTPGNGGSFTASVSGNGRWVVFASDATNLVRPATPEATTNVYVKDLRTGLVDLVSVDRAGAPLTNAAQPQVSADGRFVAYMSLSADVVAGDTNDQPDVFVRDRKLGTTVRASVSTTGQQALGGASTHPAISADGTTVAFLSEATNLVRGDTNAASDIFVRASSRGVTTRVSTGPGRRQADGPVGNGIRGGLAFGPAISADGRFVAFHSEATNLVADDTNTCTFVGGQSFPGAGQCPDAFVNDRATHTTTRVSVSTLGAQADDASTDPAISADGHSVAFLSTASNLTAHDTNTCAFPLFTSHPGQCPDVYVHAR